MPIPSSRPQRPGLPGFPGPPGRRPRPLPDGLAEGVVVRVDRGAATVESAGERVRAGWGGALLGALGHDLEGWPCAGDRVAWRSWPDGRATVEAVLPRRTLLRRSDASRGARLQPLAANVDRVAVVEALQPDPDPVRVQRLLALARASGAEPLLVLTKADLVPDPGRPAAVLVASLADEPHGAPCRVLVVSAATGAGLAGLAGLLAGRTTALLGASGAGKSSLLEALSGPAGRTGPGRPAVGVRALPAGRRVRSGTVTRELHHVAGGAVIDGPGLRSVSLADAEGLDRAFQDLVDLAAGCWSRECGHVAGPGCELLAAVERGDLDCRRLDAWLGRGGQASGW